MNGQLNAIFPFEFDQYQDFSAYAKELIRHDLIQHVNNRGFHYQFKLDGTFVVPLKTIDELFAPFGQVWGGRETFVVHDRYVLHPVVINATHDTLTISISGTTDRDYVDIIRKELTEAFASFKKPSYKKVDVEWAIPGRGEIRYAEVESVLDEEIVPEAYPQIPNLDEYIKAFLDGKEAVLILHGPPGTGKTRLIRHIIGEVGKRKEHSPRVLYSMDEKIFGDESFFFRFLTYGFDALVLEDIDFNLKSRRSGNTFMYKLLGGSDGFIKVVGKKIIMSTNIPNISDMDEALMRPGRCFGVVTMRKLTRDEAQLFIEKNRPEKLDKFNKTRKDSFSLAELYSL